jgi:hypothetical protein
MCNVHCCNHPSSRDMMSFWGLVLKRMSESQLGGRHATVGQCVCMTWGITFSDPARIES